LRLDPARIVNIEPDILALSEGDRPQRDPGQIMHPRGTIAGIPDFKGMVPLIIGDDEASPRHHGSA